MSGMSKQRDAKAKGCHSQWDVKAMGCQSNIGDPSLVTLGGRPMRQNWRQDSTLENDMWYGGRILGGRIMKRMMSWTPTPSHLMKQMPRKRGPRHKGLESTKWNDEISYLGSEKLMSFWAIFLVLHFASLICGNPLFGCYKGGNIRSYTYWCCLMLVANTVAYCNLQLSLCGFAAFLDANLWWQDNTVLDSTIHVC